MKKKTKQILSALLAAVLLVGGVTGTVVYHVQHPKKVRHMDYSKATGELINPNATPEAKALMAYLKSIYGKKMLTGQYINEYDNYALPKFRVHPEEENSPSTVFKAYELEAVHKVTGEYPAVLGLDMSGIECGARCSSIEQAIEWHKAGGIVTICWHWKVDNMDGKYREFYTDYTDFDLKKALADKNSDLYQGLIKDIDILSEEFKKLQEAGVPVLWRPLHEASGGWFWWGAAGAESYKELWNLLYDRMVNVHGLNNLIWVYNAQNPKWYVGDDKCDIIGDDPYYDYNERKYYERDKGNVKRFTVNQKTSQNKMIAMTENDFVPEIETAFAADARWLFYCTWCREFVCVYEKDKDGENAALSPTYSEKCTKEEELKAVYADERSVSLEELPSLEAFS